MVPEIIATYILQNHQPNTVSINNRHSKPHPETPAQQSDIPYASTLTPEE